LIAKIEISGTMSILFVDCWYSFY